MNKRNVVLAILASMLVIGQERSSSVSKEQWEFCKVVALGTREPSAGMIEGIANICIFAEDGCRSEDVVFSERVGQTGGLKRGQEFRLPSIATSRALTQLGKRGWDLVSVFRDPTSDRVEFYLKRRIN